MNYKRIYQEIVSSGKQKQEQRLEQKKDGKYFERHHILPLSLGGSNLDENIVILTAREHYLCHWLLYKIFPGKEMAFSWWMLSNNSGNSTHKERKIQSSRKYEYSRIAFSKHITALNTGRKISEEQKIKLSESKTGIKNPMFGIKHSDEFKQYLSKINTGENNKFYGKTHTKESKEKMSAAAKLRIGEKSNRFGKEVSAETRRLYSDMYKGKPRAVPHDIVTCPHCNKQGIKPNMKRWHFENCKEIKI